MITLDQAKSLGYGDTIYSKYYNNADGTPQRFKVNGQVKVWKRTPNRVQVPLKRGLYEFGYLDESELNDFCLTEQEAELARAEQEMRTELN